MATIHIVLIAPNDWVVREEGGRELGHYPTQAEAENVGRTLARKRRVDLVINASDGGVPIREKPKGWFRRLFGG